MNVQFHHLQFSPLSRVGALTFAAMMALQVATAFAHSDALLMNVGGQVVVGTAEDIDGPDETFGLDVGVIESILRTGFAPPAPADYEGDEPGFFGLHGVNDAGDLASLGASALPAGASASGSLAPFTANGNVDSLFYWDGVGNVDFQPISIAQPGVTFAFKPAAFGSTGTNGDLDDHPIYQINAAAGTPADGIYLIAPQIGVVGLTTSEPFYMAFLVDALIEDEDDLELVEAALEGLEAGTTPDAVADFGGGVMKNFTFYEEGVEWIESNLFVPEPGTLSLTLVGFAAAVAGRRRAISAPGSAGGSA